MNNNIIIIEKISVNVQGIAGNGMSGNGINDIDTISNDINQIISNIQI